MKWACSAWYNNNTHGMKWGCSAWHNNLFRHTTLWLRIHETTVYIKLPVWIRLRIGKWRTEIFKLWNGVKIKGVWSIAPGKGRWSGSTTGGFVSKTKCRSNVVLPPIYSVRISGHPRRLVNKASPHNHRERFYLTFFFVDFRMMSCSHFVSGYIYPTFFALCKAVY